MDLQFNCPNCSLLMQLAQDHAGGMVQCPNCSQQFMVEASAPVVPVVKAQAVNVLAPSLHANPPVSRPGMPPRGATRPRVERRPAPEPSGGAMRLVALGAAVLVLIIAVVWLTHSGGNDEKIAAEKAREEQIKIEEENARQAAQAELALKEADLKRKAEETQLQADALKRQEEQRKKEEEEKADRTEKLHLLADKYFSGDTAAFEAFNKCWQSAYFDFERLMTDNDPSNDLQTHDEANEYRCKRLIVHLQQDETLCRWVKDHGRDPEKFVRELLGMKSEVASAAHKAGAFDFSKYQSSGSGFFISNDGWIFTNEHVVGSSTLVDVRLLDGKILQAKVVKTDDAADLALLKVEEATASWLAITKGDTDLQLGRTVLTVGYPAPMVQGVEPKFTDGKISAASGIGDRKDSYQTTVPVQHGNSGGALVDAATGWAVGVINARLEDSEGRTADNVSYGIKGKIAKSFLDTVAEAKSATEKTLPPPMSKTNAGDPVIDRATSASVLILRPR